MTKRILFFCSLLVVLGMLTALTIPVLADDTTPPPDATTEVVATDPPATDVTPTEVAPTDPTPTDPAPTEDAGTEGPGLLAGALFAPQTIDTPTPPDQTTLSATKSAIGHWDRTFHWTIDKSVSPDTLNMFTGDSGDVTYTIAVTKDSGTDTFSVSGQICVTNGGAVATENLAIVDELQFKAPGPHTDWETLTTTNVDLSEKPNLAAGESYCYDYSIDFTPVTGASYRNIAHATITNHAGWEPGDHNCPGTALCPFGPDPTASFSLPTTPNLIHDSINVDDTNGGTWGFNDSGSVTYGKTFTCDRDEGENDNTATIRQTGQSDDATVTVNCYALTVHKTAVTAFKRTFQWNIHKSADQNFLTLAVGQQFVVNYTVTVDAPTYTDSDFGVSGYITISNPAPMDATLTDVTDVISPAISADVVCPSMTVPAEDDLVCTYSASLPDKADRTNTATATLQNTPSGTTDFTGHANVHFSATPSTLVDQSGAVTDTLGGALGAVTYTDTFPKTFTYSYTVGPYATCGRYSVPNIATLTTNTTGTTYHANWNVDVNIPCNLGCTLTIGYWKTHAGFGPQPDMVSARLPQWLGIPLPFSKSQFVGTPAKAVQFLSFDGSNNVFDASNGINKLYAQLLGAKLNIAAGASSSSISSTIGAADLFLTTHNSLDWSSLSKSDKNKVLGWMTTLDNFNNGLVGPGHCSQ